MFETCSCQVHNFGIDNFEVTMQAPDELHAKCLGVDQRYCGVVLVRALLDDVWGTSKTSADELLQAGVLQMRVALASYYATERRLDPDRKLSKIDRITVSMLGDIHKPCLHSKGGEAKDLVKFVTQLCKLNAQTNDFYKIGAIAGDALLEFNSIVRMNSAVLPNADQQALVKASVRHVTTYAALGGAYVPKHHEFIHLALASKWFGNPRNISTWHDEHENGCVARLCVTIHPDTFCESVFERIMVLELLV
jgi:hypothetical protein